MNRQVEQAEGETTRGAKDERQEEYWRSSGKSKSWKSIWGTRRLMKGDKCWKVGRRSTGWPSCALRWEVWKEQESESILEGMQ